MYMHKHKHILTLFLVVLSSIFVCLIEKCHCVCTCFCCVTKLSTLSLLLHIHYTSLCNLRPLSPSNTDTSQPIGLPCWCPPAVALDLSPEVNTMTGISLTSCIIPQDCLPLTVRDEKWEDSSLFKVRCCQDGLGGCRCWQSAPLCGFELK